MTKAVRFTLLSRKNTTGYIPAPFLRNNISVCSGWANTFVIAQQYFRMLWLGEYLRQKYNWHLQFHEISPQMALKYALLKQYGEKFTDIDALTQEEMSLALTDYWSE
ncbi:hypothetical protein N4Q71_30430, partial [Salmonella enterica subsp. enterica serovar Montevideo]